MNYVESHKCPDNLALLIVYIIYHGRANGLRYPRWGGRQNAVQCEK